MVAIPGTQSCLSLREFPTGVWSTIDSPVVARILGRAGFGMVVIDLQHGYASSAEAFTLIDAAGRDGTPTMVRVAHNTDQAIGRALDAGAEGVVIPMVSSVSDADRAARACRYAPWGTRSWGPLGQGLRDNIPTAADAKHSTTCIVMIETADGLAAAGEIAAVAGVDALYVGPNDLSLSLGLGRVSPFESPELESAIGAVIDAAHAADTAVGVDCRGAAEISHWRRRGADFVIANDDTSMLLAAAAAAVDSPS